MPSPGWGISDDVDSRPEWAPLPEKTVDIAPDSLEAFVDGFVATEHHLGAFAGAMASVVKRGEVLLKKGYGQSDIAAGREVSAEQTLFRLGSTSKLFTWIAAMQLVEQGKVDLHGDVNQYLTQFQIPDTYAKPVTLWHLMTHTAGFEDGWAGFLIVRDFQRIRPLASSLRLHMPARVRPVGEPDSPLASSYSNWGAALAGLIVANVSGMPFERYVEQNIFEPLGMRASTFEEPLPEHLASRLSRGYIRNGDSLEPGWMEYLGTFGPAGAISSSLNDMTRFLRMLSLGGELEGKRILRERTLNEMFSTAHSPGRHAPGFGLGFEEYHVNGRRLIGHGGDTAFFHTEIVLFPEDGTGLFFSVNTAQAGALPRDFIQVFMDRYYPDTLPDTKIVTSVADGLEQYSGAFRSTRRAYTTNEKLLALPKALHVSVSGKKRLLVRDFGEMRQFAWVETDTFREVSSGDVLEFVRDGQGDIVGLVGIGSFERLSWYETAFFHQSLALLVSVIFMLSAGLIILRWRRDADHPPLARWSIRGSGIISILGLAAIIMLARILTVNPVELVDTYPAIFLTGLWLVVVLVPLIFVQCTLLGYCLCRKEFGLLQSIQAVLYVLACAMFVGALAYWNLIGFHFP